MTKYDYLKRYINKPYESPSCHNYFGRVTAEEIMQVENKVNFKFPESLKEFWLEIGSGAIKQTINGVVDRSCNNYICSPTQIADLMYIMSKEDGYLDEGELPELTVFMTPEACEYFEEGDLPFFEIGDSSSFLMMKPNSGKPEAIYNILGRIVAENMEQFIWKLYHESPTFYLNIED